MRKGWRWIRDVFSLRAVMRDMQLLIYVGQPLAFTKRRGLHIIPRTSWRRQIKGSSHGQS